MRFPHFFCRRRQQTPLVGASSFQYLHGRTERTAPRGVFPGKSRGAADLRERGQVMGRPVRRQRPVRFHLFVALGVVALATVGLWWGLSRQGDWQHWLGCWLVAVNVVTFGYFG